MEPMESIEDLESLLQASRSRQGRSILASKDLVPTLLEKISSSIHLITCLRLLRNLCAGEINNQNSFIQNGGVEVMKSTLLPSELLETSVPVDVIHVGLQLLGNVVAAGEECRCVVWSHFFGPRFFELVTIMNDGVCDPLCMILYMCCCNSDGGGGTRFRMKELLGDEVGFSIVLKIITTASSVGHHGDWLVLLISRLCFQETCFLKLFSELRYFNFNKRCTNTDIGKLHFTKEQSFLLNILSENLNEGSYKDTISSDLTSTILQVLKDASSIVDFTSRGMSALPTTTPANDVLGFSLNILRDLCATNEPLDLLLSTDICNTLLELLRELEPPTIIRRSYGNGENTQQPSFLNMTGTISGNVCPYKGYRRDLVATLGNVMFEKRHIQDEIRRQDGILLLLQQCITDDDNPFLKEWAIWTLRNLLEGNLENQKVVAELEVQGPVNSPDVSAMGFRVEVDQKSRRAKLVNQ